MNPMKRPMILLLLVLLALAAAAGAYLLLEDRGSAKEAQRAAAIEAAERWIRNHSPTFVYDGTGLELREVELLVREGEEPVAYEMLFEFESRHSGYGDREGEMLAQVITAHTLKIRVEKGPDSSGWKVVRAVNDGVFDERAGEFLEVLEERETEWVELYFMRVEDGLEKAVPVSRKVSTAGGLEVSTLEALLEGPRPEEKEKDYYSSIPDGVEIEHFEMQAGRASVSFNSELDRDVAGSARV